MAQTSQAYTPAEILQAGFQAEADGRIEHAVQFYRHLADYHKSTPEAGEARRALQRFSATPATARAEPRPLSMALEPRRAAEAQPPPTSARTSASAIPRPQAAEPPQSPREASRNTLVLPPPARGYLVGRALAVLLLVIAGLSVLAGLALLGYGAANGLDRPTPVGVSAISAGPILVLAGLAVALVAQLFLAVFRIANATADLAAVARARARAEAGDQ